MLVAGLGLAVIVLLVVVFYCYLRRKKSGRAAKETKARDVRLEVNNVVESRTSSASDEELQHKLDEKSAAAYNMGTSQHDMITHI